MEWTWEYSPPIILDLNPTEQDSKPYNARETTVATVEYKIGHQNKTTACWIGHSRTTVDQAAVAKQPEDIASILAGIYFNLWRLNLSYNLKVCTYYIV